MNTIKTLASQVNLLPLIAAEIGTDWKSHLTTQLTILRDQITEEMLEEIVSTEFNKTNVTTTMVTGFTQTSIPPYCIELMKHISAALGCTLAEKEGKLDLTLEGFKNAAFHIVGKKESTVYVAVMYIHLYRQIQKATDKTQYIESMELVINLLTAYAEVEGVGFKSIIARQKKLEKSFAE
jgi:hypothetical protein